MEPGIVTADPWLTPHAGVIEQRQRYAREKELFITENGRVSLKEFAAGHDYYGLHRESGCWVFREWAPGATSITLTGDFSNWEESPQFDLKRLGGCGDWETRIPLELMSHGQHYKMRVRWNGGSGDRIPAWATRVVQDRETSIFSAQIWDPQEKYKFSSGRVSLSPEEPLLIYECHIGMAQEKEGVGSYTEFRENVLPRVKRAGYNCIQIMAIQEHPYYGSFGYHVSSFFAPSSRFGTPEELKQLIDAAHSEGIMVIMDLVHSHAVKNENEGIGNLAGDRNQYFLPGTRHEHSAWDSLCFDYGKPEVLKFLLSNCRYWLEEFQFDGFRFDGVTSMIYISHGLGESFCSYDDYFNGAQDVDAISYLMLANKLIHTVKKDAVTIAEEVSGMPGIAARLEDGGYGFDYRLAMNIPDNWIKVIKERRDEEWSVNGLFHELTNRRSDERTISYVESHDQALVGDKTVAFRLMDSDMYWHFGKNNGNSITARGIALHKMIRLLTLSTINGGYLNFMGNEFGHPEWIDFPRQGNGWSYKYARRQWSLVDNPDLSFSWLAEFDRSMLEIVCSVPAMHATPVVGLCLNEADQVLAYSRGELLFVYNFSPDRSYTDYGILVPKGCYSMVLDSDSGEYGGNSLIDGGVEHVTIPDLLHADSEKEWVRLYIPARTAQVLRLKKG